MQGRKSRPKSNSTVEPILHQQRRGRPSKVVSNRGLTTNDVVKQTRIQSPVQSPRTTAGSSQQSSMDADNAHSVISHSNRVSTQTYFPHLWYTKWLQVEPFERYRLSCFFCLEAPLCNDSFAWELVVGVTVAQFSETFTSSKVRVALSYHSPTSWNAWWCLEERMPIAWNASRVVT